LLGQVNFGQGQYRTWLWNLLPTFNVDYG